MDTFLAIKFMGRSKIKDVLQRSEKGKMEELIGNDKVKETLKNMVKNQKVAHSYLFSGIEGIGKTLFAREFAKTLLCEEQKEMPCGKCRSCRSFAENNHPDFMQIEPDGKAIKIEQIRYMQEKIAEKPIQSNFKIYILKDADTMTREAQNSLLKTLEEPPMYARMILVTSNENKLLNTIKSRCIKIPFLPIEMEKIKKYMQKNFSMELSENELTVCAGSIGKAIGVQELLAQYRQIEGMIQNLDKQDLLSSLKESEFLHKEKDNILELLDYMLVILYKSKDRAKINAIHYVEDTKQRILANSNYDMAIDYLWIRVWEEVNEKYNRC